MHGYIVKYQTKEEVCVIDNGLEKLLKAYSKISAQVPYTDNLSVL